MTLSKIISTIVQKGMLIVKILASGSSDIKTVYNLLPFGIDSNPTKDYRAIYGNTDVKGENILFGVINKNVLTNVGEVRLHAENTSGNEVFFIHLKNDGNCEMNGNIDNFVRYQKLEDGLSNMVTNINTELLKIQTAISTLGGSYVKSDITLDISDSKIDNIKTA
jgi:hypothetical protein